MKSGLIGLICIIMVCYLRQVKLNRKLQLELSTSLRSLEQYTDIRTEKQQELDKQKEHFIEVLLHDLKTPTLAQLRGLELLNNSAFGKMNDEQNYMVSEIKKSCRYTLDMIDMVLNVYRLNDGEEQLKYEQFNLIELVKECLLTSSDTYAAYELETNFEGIIRADRQEIKKVIQRLLENAITYSDKKTPIRIQIESSDIQVKVSIITTGITLSEEDCKEVFNDDGLHFSTIGHRIGLYMSKKIINLHQGEIFALTDGKTSNTFSFIIPVHTPINPTNSQSEEISHHASY